MWYPLYGFLFLNIVCLAFSSQCFELRLHADERGFVDKENAKHCTERGSLRTFSDFNKEEEAAMVWKCHSSTGCKKKFQRPVQRKGKEDRGRDRLTTLNNGLGRHSLKPRQYLTTAHTGVDAATYTTSKDETSAEAMQMYSYRRTLRTDMLIETRTMHSPKVFLSSTIA